MIREVAQISIREGARGQFVADLSRAVAEILPDVEGVIEFVHVGWCMERPNVYMFTIDWETLDDHLVRFRESEQFTQWRTLIGPHFDGSAVVEHFSL
ncbi:MAG: antibiotic biosynthesis monooxygenase [Candidatus Nanopelagicales bacterium]|nr:antibiotic biosynthesis monooxygenase [Candidatus Nanopelagicales bacterium]